MDMPTEYRYYHKNDNIGGKIFLILENLSISEGIRLEYRKLPRNMHRMNAQLHIVEVIQQTENFELKSQIK